jgi:hypothetical protein
MVDGVMSLLAEVAVHVFDVIVERFEVALDQLIVESLSNRSRHEPRAASGFNPMQTGREFSWRIRTANHGFLIDIVGQPVEIDHVTVPLGFHQSEFEIVDHGLIQAVDIAVDVAHDDGLWEAVQPSGLGRNALSRVRDGDEKWLHRRLLSYVEGYHGGIWRI